MSGNEKSISFSLKKFTFLIVMFMKLEVVKKFMKGNENQKGSHFLRKNQMHSHARHAHHREKKSLARCIRDH